MGLALTDGDVAALDGRTEGWIAALQLAALSMQGRDDASAFIAGFAGDDRYIVDYLAEEVLARQPADVRDFLLQTSILDRLTGPLCDAVTGRDGGRATLVALERANLFLVPLDDRRQWYRYHHLFADVLQAHLLDERAERGPRAAPAGQRLVRAERRHVRRPSSTPWRAGTSTRAADLMELAIPAMRRERREAELGAGCGAARRGGAGPARCSASRSSVRSRRCRRVRHRRARLSDVERSLRADGRRPGRSSHRRLVVVDEEGFRRLPGDRRGVPGRAGAG